MVSLSAQPERALGRSGRRSNIDTLLGLSALMSSAGDSSEVLDLAVAAASRLAPCRAVGVIGEAGWRLKLPLVAAEPELEAALMAQLPAVVREGGRLELPGWRWSFAHALRHLDSHQGVLVVAAGEEPDLEEQLLLDALARQTGFVLATLTLMRRERETAYELARTNTALSRLVQELQRTVEIHRRLDDVVSSGAGEEGLALSLHELTGLPAALEDGFGNLLAWAPGIPSDPPQPLTETVRDQLQRELRSSRRPARLGQRVVALASSRYHVGVFLSLVDGEGTAGDLELEALNHAATVLTMELARRASSAEAELRLGRDLVEDLLAGEDEEAIRRRAMALGCDLARARRVAVVALPGLRLDDDAFLAVRKVGREHRVATLSTRRLGHVVLLVEMEPDWEEFRDALREALPGGGCRLGVGAACAGPGDFARSYKEARLALRLSPLGSAGVGCWEDLGIFRFLSSLDDLAGLEVLVEEQLGILLRHDAERQADLVATLCHWLDAGASNVAAARALAVHPSTVKYRVQRIRELAGYDLTCPRTRFTLQFATKAWQLLRALDSHEA